MPTFDLLAPPPNFLPQALLQCNVLDVTMVYVTLAFVASLALRVRQYWTIYRIAKFSAESCPNVVKLLHQHLAGLVQNGLVPMLLAYGAVFLVYFVVTRFALPNASLSVAELARWPATAAWALAMFGATLAIDAALMLQVAEIDEGFVREQLVYAEQWLGGRLNRALDLLGKWNPLRYYANVQTRLALADFNALFRYSLALTIFQTAVRLALVATLFVAAMRLRLPVPPAL